MAGIVEKLQKMWNPPDDEYDEYYEDEATEPTADSREEQPSARRSFSSSSSNRVVNINHARAGAQVVVFKPNSFRDDTNSIADEINQGHTVVVNFDETNESSGIYSKAVNINWIDSILTKPIAPDLGVTSNDSIYGSDPVEIVNDWVTIAEDGYLTLRFRTIWGDRNKAHFVNLLTGKDPENPYEVEFRHNAYGDVYGAYADGLVAFKLDSLPDTNGKTVKLKLKWKSFDGDKSVEFNYCSRKSTPAKASIAAERSALNLK